MPRTKARLAGDVRTVLAELKELGTPEGVAGMARFGIQAKKVFGISVNELRKLAKTIGKDHELALALWETGWFEARLLASMLDDPAEVTPSQMEHWVKDFENWADCDTVCFHLFDKTPHTFAKINQWSKRKNEFEKRAAYALLASVALHDKKLKDEPFLKCLPLCANAAGDSRNFVKKGVSWALRGIGTRSPKLRDQAIALAEELAASKDATERWVGKDVLRDLRRPLVAERVRKKVAKG